MYQGSSLTQDILMAESSHLSQTPLRPKWDELKDCSLRVLQAARASLAPHRGQALRVLHECFRLCGFGLLQRHDVLKTKCCFWLWLHFLPEINTTAQVYWDHNLASDVRGIMPGKYYNTFASAIQGTALVLSLEKKNLLSLVRDCHKSHLWVEEEDISEKIRFTEVCTESSREVIAENVGLHSMTCMYWK